MFDLKKNSKANEAELQDFLFMEKQRAQFLAKIHKSNIFCCKKA